MAPRFDTLPPQHCKKQRKIVRCVCVFIRPQFCFSINHDSLSWVFIHGQAVPFVSVSNKVGPQVNALSRVMCDVTDLRGQRVKGKEGVLTPGSGPV